MQGFSNARDAFQEAFCYLCPVHLEISVTDALEEYVCISQTPILSDSLSEGGWCFKEEKKAELQNLPLSRAAFLEGVKRAQNQFIIWKSASGIYPNKPMSDNYGWKRDCCKYISVMITASSPSPPRPLCS